jgi:hypothetical protein
MTLVREIEDAAMPGIARASAVALLSRYLSPRSFGAVERALADADHLLQMVAVPVLDAVAPLIRLRLAEPLLQDPIRPCGSKPYGWWRRWTGRS